MRSDKKELKDNHAEQLNNEENRIEENKTEDKKIEEAIRQDAETVEVPESLRPENIEKLLQGRQQQETQEESQEKSQRESVQGESSVSCAEGKKKSWRWKPFYTVAAAACCVIAVGVAALGQNSGLWGSASGANEAAESETTKEVSDSAKDSGTDEKTGEADKAGIAVAKDYDEIYQYIQAESERQDKQSRNIGYVEESTYDGAASANDTASAAGSDSAGSEKMASFADTGEANYSDTNVREDGVAEGDVVKTDGKYLYILNNQKVQIVSIEKEQMEQMGTIRVDEDRYISEIYVKDGKLLMVYSETEYTDGENGYGGTYKQYTVAETYDVSNPKEPKSIGKVRQSGDFHTMRISGDYVYLLSNFYADMSAAKRDVEAYIPQVQGKTITSGSIYMPQYQSGNQYTVISSFSLKDPDKKVESKAVFGCSGMVYVSRNNIYVCEAVYDTGESDVTQTCIRKIEYKDGVLNGVGNTKVDGTLNDSFSIDEYDGNLRLVTTVSGNGSNGIMPLITFGDTVDITTNKIEDSNSLYVLDENLQMLGSIEGLAKGEQVYSARFMGDVGYFVTYKQVDPLFSVDISDPKNPEVTGTLKIPGFSEYLHPVGDDLLLGIGMDVDETGTTTNGVKLSLFDVSDPTGAEEIAKYVIEDCYSTDVAYNYKAVFVDTEKKLVGFSGYGQGQHYYVFSYGKDGFQCIFDRDLNGYSDARGLYAGETFYLVAGNTVESYQIGSWKKLDDIVL